MSEDFIPDEVNRIGEPVDTFLVDPGFDPDNPAYYRVSAWDLHENESDFALLRPEDVVSGLVPPTPKVTGLEQNMPNPFAEGTVIRFSLAETGYVMLKVSDVQRRPVRTLVEGTRAGQLRYPLGQLR